MIDYGMPDDDKGVGPTKDSQEQVRPHRDARRWPLLGVGVGVIATVTANTIPDVRLPKPFGDNARPSSKETSARPGPRLQPQVSPRLQGLPLDNEGWFSSTYLRPIVVVASDDQTLDGFDQPPGGKDARVARRVLERMNEWLRGQRGVIVQLADQIDVLPIGRTVKEVLASGDQTFGFLEGAVTERLGAAPPNEYRMVYYFGSVKTTAQVRDHVAVVCGAGSVRGNFSVVLANNTRASCGSTTRYDSDYELARATIHELEHNLGAEHETEETANYSDWTDVMGVESNPDSKAPRTLRDGQPPEIDADESDYWGRGPDGRGADGKPLRTNIASHPIFRAGSPEVEKIIRETANRGSQSTASANPTTGTQMTTNSEQFWRVFGDRLVIVSPYGRFVIGSEDRALWQALTGEHVLVGKAQLESGRTVYLTEESALGLSVDGNVEEVWRLPRDGEGQWISCLHLNSRTEPVELAELKGCAAEQGLTLG